MSGPASLDADYFDGIFASDDDPWQLASSRYEAAKFSRTIAAIDDRRYASGLEVGCAHGVLTERLAPLCDDLLAIDISRRAIELAERRAGARKGLRFARMAFPGETPAGRFDLVVLSEVAYYWNDADIAHAARWLVGGMIPDGRLIAVHWTGETDYPQTGDRATETLWRGLAADFTVERARRAAKYRLDLWRRR